MTPVERKGAMKYLVARCNYLEASGLSDSTIRTRVREAYQRRNKCSAIDQAIAHNVAFRMGLVTAGDFAVVEWNNSRNL